MFMCYVANPRNINIFRPGTRPGGSVTGVTEKLFMCQTFVCFFSPLKSEKNQNSGMASLSQESGTLALWCRAKIGMNLQTFSERFPESLRRDFSEPKPYKHARNCRRCHVIMTHTNNFSPPGYEGKAHTKQRGSSCGWSCIGRILNPLSRLAPKMGIQRGLRLMIRA